MVPAKPQREVIDILPERRTSAEAVYLDLHDRIVSMDILPGTKMSEVEVAERYGVSRQPVRDAFTRLSALGFLLVQPQRATEVRRFSQADISAARFIRLAVELEIVRTACAMWSESYRHRFQDNIAAQEEAAVDRDTMRFHKLDGRFHGLITQVAQRDFAAELIAHNRSKVHRICTLSLRHEEEMAELIADHRALYMAISERDAARAETVLRSHLQRIEDTIRVARENHSEFFED